MSIPVVISLVKNTGFCVDLGFSVLLPATTVITHQGESVCVRALLNFPVTNLLAFAVKQKYHKMVAATDR